MLVSTSSRTTGKTRRDNIRLKDKVAIIIGCAKGAGKILAMNFANLLSTSSSKEVVNTFYWHRPVKAAKVVVLLQPFTLFT